MNNFTIPPPPPPPPKATPDISSSYSQVNYGRGNRGTFRGRGRGSSFRGSNARGGSFHGSNVAHQYQRNSQNLHNGGHVTPQNNAVQSSNTYAASYGSNTQVYAPNQAPTPLNRTGQTWSSEPSGGRHFKRKRDGHAHHFQPKQDPIYKPRIEVAPSVPSFGFTLPSQAHGLGGAPPMKGAAPQDRSERQPAKRKTNQLGLTPQGDMIEESEDEAEDEEAAHAAYTGPLRVEYNGVILELGSPEALKQWIEERRKKWPTRARIEERKKQALKQEQEALRRRLEADQARKRDLEARVKGHEERRQREKEDKDAKDRRALEKHLAKAEKLQKKLGIGASGSDIIPPSTEYPTENATDNTLLATDGVDPAPKSEDKPANQPLTAVGDLLKKPDENISASDSQRSSSGDSDSDSSANAPEEASSKAEGPVHVQPPTKEAGQRVCREFALRGHCRRGDRCYFKHEPSGPSTRIKRDAHKQTTSTKRKTLYQKLVEQEQEAEDRLVLQAVKYLGQNGYLDIGG